MEERHKEVGDRDGHTVGPCPGAEQRLQQRRERRFSDKAQADAREGDPHLTDGKILVHVRLDMLDKLRPGVALIDELLDPRRTHLDDRELRQDEKRVKENQGKSYEN